jgi:hypothetical protein
MVENKSQRIIGAEAGTLALSLQESLTSRAAASRQNSKDEGDGNHVDPKEVVGEQAQDHA